MNRKGTSFIDIIISLGIIAALFWGIYLIYFSLIDSVTNIEARTAATEAINQEIEMMRDLPYASVGTVGGAPSGIIPQVQTLGIGNYNFSVNTTIRNVDDPFDGVLGGSPNDTAPADYKLVQFDVSCPACAHFIPLSFTTTIAPKDLETASSSGSLFVNVFDASGNGIAGASVQVVNSSVIPTINLTDITNASGVLQLVGVPTSTASYHVMVSDAGYSSDQTYPTGGQGNPNPAKPDATVAAGTVTSLSFSIDRTSRLSVETSDVFCSAIGARTFTTAGTKVIGPGILKFSTSSVTDANGSYVFQAMEWDTYALALGGSSYDVVGTIPFSPLTINPSSTADFRFVLRAAQPDSLLVTAADASTGAAIPGATVTITKGAYVNTLITGHIAVADTDWSSGNYGSQDGGIDATSVPGSISLLANASGTYNTSTVDWLISRTIDLGSSTDNYYALSWNPSAQPAQTGPSSVQFQLAANNDNATWNFIGPDGTADSYYVASSTLVGFDNMRYVRYKIFLSTEDPNTAPSVTDVAFDVHPACAPVSQVLFSGLSSGNYSIDITAPQYIEATGSVSVAGSWQEGKIQLTHQ